MPSIKPQWIASAVAACAVLVTFAFVQQDAGDGDEEPPTASATDSIVQPIAFPHDVHVDDYRMECQYCHYSAERSVDAGMPPVGTCIGCHQVVQGQDNPEEVAKIREYYDAGEPIPWVRVYKVSDHVRFPHMRHVNAGVECQFCHGQVEEMGVVEEVAQPLDMGWCVSCHVERGAARDCTVCHY